jgi:LAO/AO transport system kinase
MSKKPDMLSDRASLARAITLIESTRDDHQKEAQALLAEILPKTGNSIRIGITGAPGVGKSTFIEAFGLYVIEQGHKVAVLAVDPSSTLTGGSILGDKTRMAQLSQNDNAYIRPSPTGGALGGVARRTREAMLLCETAGYDVIIVETVGVGQSETEVADMVDMFTLLLLPGSGDELQGIKKGIVELADLIVVTKADGDLKAQAKRVRTDYSAAIRMLRPSSETWQPKVMTCSALHNEGVDEVWKSVSEFRKMMEKSGELKRQRARQAVAWMWKEIREKLISRFMQDKKVAAQLEKMERAVQEGKITPTEAARELIKSCEPRSGSTGS